MHASTAVTNEDTLGIELVTTFDAVADAVRERRLDLGVPAAPDGTVTLLFTDIEASTLLAERIGDARWTRLLRWMRAITYESAQARRGYVVKSLGDGFMIAFPSTSDGIGAAIEIRDRVAKGGRVSRSASTAGLHSGDAVPRPRRLLRSRGDGRGAGGGARGGERDTRDACRPRACAWWRLRVRRSARSRS